MLLPGTHQARPTDSLPIKKIADDSGGRGEGECDVASGEGVEARRRERRSSADGYIRRRAADAASVAISASPSRPEPRARSPNYTIAPQLLSFAPHLNKGTYFFLKQKKITFCLFKKFTFFLMKTRDVLTLSYKGGQSLTFS